MNGNIIKSAREGNKNSFLPYTRFRWIIDLVLNKPGPGHISSCLARAFVAENSQSVAHRLIIKHSAEEEGVFSLSFRPGIFLVVIKLLH